MVIGNQGKDFCLGANIGIFLIAAGDPKQMAAILDQMQQWIQNLRYSPKPIVTALRQRALGGGVEMGLLASRIAASAETYMGLVEFGVGVIPAFGGCKELLRRNVSPHITSDSVNALPYLQKVFETIAYAKVSESAESARELGFLVREDRVIVNDEHLLDSAKRMAIDLADAGYRPPARDAKTIYAIGKKGKAAMSTAIDTLRWGKHISDYDAFMARTLAHVLCGGDLSQPQWVTEQHILDLEREAFITLVQQPKSQERIAHMLKNGKPLRN
jgi:3-hydroxyacyl-CoA dehydrogenase